MQLYDEQDDASIPISEAAPWLHQSRGILSDHLSKQKVGYHYHSMESTHLRHTVCKLDFPPFDQTWVSRMPLCRKTLSIATGLPVKLEVLYIFSLFYTLLAGADKIILMTDNQISSTVTKQLWRVSGMQLGPL